MKKKGLIIAIAAALVLAAVLLTVFLKPGKEAPQEPAATEAPAPSASKVVNVYNWYDYMDEEVFDLFEQETGIHVNKIKLITGFYAQADDHTILFVSPVCIVRMSHKCRF